LEGAGRAKLAAGVPVHPSKTLSLPGEPFAMLLNTFVRLTLLIALAVVVLFIAAFVLKIVLVAAIVAAVVVGILFAVNLFRRGRKLPVIR
jgi:hypothetical protein